jgi:phospholipase/carboxylesterase
VTEQTRELGGLRTAIVGSPDAALHLVLLHGYGMRAADLSPFASSLGAGALTFVPDGPLSVELGRAWWDSLSERRPGRGQRTPRDLAQKDPAGRAAARTALTNFIAGIHSWVAPRPLVLAGFSQGGMLACDAVLAGAVRVAGLALMSSSRIAIAEWTEARERLKGVPVFVSHGRRDDDLAFAAGEALRDFAADAGAAVTWVAFDEGHELPLIVWRELRKFLRDVVAHEHN